MAKKEGNEVAVAEKQNVGIITVQTDDGETQLDVAEALANLKNLKEGASLTGSYLTFEEVDLGIKRKFIYIGTTRIKKINGEDGEMVDAVKFLDGETGNSLTNADRVLLSTCAGLKAPKAISVEFTGWEKSTKGKYRTFDIRELN